MKIFFKHQAVEKKNNAACSVTEYALNTIMLDAAIATITTLSWSTSSSSSAMFSNFTEA